ncbi:MAG: DUF3160 domain-containing protein [Endomicrobium sp.]|jgi:hypothetical protein|nr:DUF3160 domain-containing protein [Endomicrobium sp.]
MKKKCLIKIVFAAYCLSMSATLPALPAAQDFMKEQEEAVTINSFEEAYLQRFAIFAKYGEIFMDCGLRNYFSLNDKNYDENMLKRWRGEFLQNEKAAKEGVFTKTQLSQEDAALVKAIDEQIAQMQKNNFIDKNGVLTANTANIINMFQFDNYSGEFMQKLSDNNMVIVKENSSRLFDIYNNNNYLQIPSFITTDLILQLSAAYISYFKFLMHSKSADASFIDPYWDKCLLALSAAHESYPAFMKLTAWQIKNLNASLSAQMSLKRGDLNFLVKEPAEKPLTGLKDKENNDIPPDAFSVGYVEPNILFWQKNEQLIDATIKALEENSLLSGDLRRKTDKLKDIAGFLSEVSLKELKGQTLSKQEYDRISWFGEEIEAVTYFFLQKPKTKQSVLPAFAEIYAKDKDVNLYRALGNANAVYAIVEIGGYLYLTKGAVFGYYEFSRPQTAKPLTALQWQKMLKEDKTLQEPAWIKDYIINSAKPPQ